MRTAVCMELTSGWLSQLLGFLLSFESLSCQEAVLFLTAGDHLKLPPGFVWSLPLLLLHGQTRRYPECMGVGLV